MDSQKFKLHFLYFLIFIFTFTGCTDGDISPHSNRHIVLRVGFVTEEKFQQRFANLIEQEFPNYRVEIVPMKDVIRYQQSIIDWIKSKQVDLLYIPSSNYQELIDANILRDLELYMDRGDFLKDSVLPSVMELDRAYGGGKVYGLPTNFYSEAIAYNQDLFERMNIPFLTDGMTWPELFYTMQRFEKGLSVHMASPFHLLTQMGQSEQIQMMNTADQMTLNSPTWETLWKVVTDAARNGGIHFDEENQNPFITGDRAAALISYDEYKILEQSKPSFKWSLVSMPTGITGQTSSIIADGYWSIPVSSNNPEDAWKMIAFFMSGKVAKWGYRSDYGFSTLKQEISLNPDDEDQLEAFYKDHPQIPLSLTWSSFLPDLVNNVFTKIVTNESSVEDGLQQLQQQAEIEVKRKQ
ncbi:extracellular solute-binding protein [Cohnella lubricantis]|uniref:Extracellular solute-binding protein n=1 Tax=Cohnella lubricantis TaxID=2163172 RepID=A0A841TIX2_9BACL|nr:extracellular solute-binding protein [Cohnella lubricantis]MBB6678877.1 extracellular solute-binding protein [Cohnella lubricantis]MBP2120202.1 multiple sugar transport system substrate-binding protein [Cohnella lubricantis]